MQPIISQFGVKLNGLTVRRYELAGASIAYERRAQYDLNILRRDDNSLVLVVVSIEDVANYWPIRIQAR